MTAKIILVTSLLGSLAAILMWTPRSVRAENISLSVSSSAHIYNFATADFPGAARTLGYGSAGGITVGIFSFNPNSAGSLAFTLHAGQYKAFSVPGATGTGPYAVNANGQIAGGYSDNSNVAHGFVDTAGTFTTIDYPGAKSTIATDVNVSGQVVGFWDDAGGHERGFIDHGGDFGFIHFLRYERLHVNANYQVGVAAGHYDNSRRPRLSYLHTLTFPV